MPPLQPDFPHLSQAGQAEAFQVVVRKPEIEGKAHTDDQAEGDEGSSNDRRIQTYNHADCKKSCPRKGHDSIDGKEKRGLPNCWGRRFLGVVVSKGVKAQNGREESRREQADVDPCHSIFSEGSRRLLWATEQGIAKGPGNMRQLPSQNRSACPSVAPAPETQAQ